MVRTQVARRTQRTTECESSASLLSWLPINNNQHVGRARQRMAASLRTVGRGEPALSTRTSSALSQLHVGELAWHRVAKQVCEVVEVHYDDIPPYYTVRMSAMAWSVRQCATGW